MRKAVVAAVLSFLVPGAGQLYLGERRRGAILLGAWAGVLVATLALVAIGRVPDLGRTFLALLLLANAAVLALRLFAIVDAGRGAFASRVAAAVLAAVVVAAVVPHVAAAYVAVRGYGVLESVFADEEPTDVLGGSSLFLAFPHAGRPPLDLDPPALRGRRSTAGAAPAPFRGVAKPLADSAKILADEEAALEHPWVTILLLGSDEGPRQAGDRTDTMIVAAIQRKTHRAVLFGVPRNLVGVDGFGEPLNALYQRRGATGLKHAISRLLGLRVDYHAMVNLDGFVEMVDALGGVRITVKERIVDEVTRPAWGETKPKIDVYPGRTYRFTGRTALAYVRSRKASNDYRRMARQRCFISALANQLDVGAVLRHFASLADAVESSVRTDIPLNRAPDLMRLAAGVDREGDPDGDVRPAVLRGPPRRPLPLPERQEDPGRSARRDPASRAREGAARDRLYEPVLLRAQKTK